MARIRTIKPQFYDDIKIGRLSRDARYLYIALWVFADDVGVVNGDTIWLKSKVFPYDQIQIKQFEGWISELVKHGFIRLLSHNGERFLYLPNFTRHQVINRPNYNELNIPKILLDKELNAITDLSLNNHGTITDLSLSIKGEEKERNKKGTNVPKEDAATAATLSRKEKFGKSLIPYVEKYGKDMVRDFFDYWTEMNQSKSKMRFEQQPTWETSKRLATWAKRDKNYADNTKGHEDRRRGYDVAATGEKDYNSSF